MKVRDHLLGAIRGAGVYNREVQVAPAVILWPDEERQWVGAISELREFLPELLVLGDYLPEERRGPAIWLRCVVAGLIPEVWDASGGATPILYLPGIGRQDLRAVERAPDHLKPLAELQYRGVIWSQLSGKDWTVLAFLKSENGGLGLDVAQDSGAKGAMQLAVGRFLEEEVDLLRGKRLDRDYFNRLLTGGDPVRDLLLWLDQGDRFREEREESEWRAFVEVCKSQLGFDPESEGVLAGNAKLAERQGGWRAVWDRFCEAPGRYRNIPDQIRRCRAPEKVVGGQSQFEGWPQWNERMEEELRSVLLGLGELGEAVARERLRELERSHGVRRNFVWAELGEASLAGALKYLVEIVEMTEGGGGFGDVGELEEFYRVQGWRVDDAMLRALAEVERQGDVEAVKVALSVFYLPWAAETARYLQERLDGSSYPGGTYLDELRREYEAGDCVLFVDGLRFDLAKRLVELLKASSFEVAERVEWAALPSVTATAKPAVSPVRQEIQGYDADENFEPSVASTQQSLRGGYHFRKLLEDGGWTILERGEPGNGEGRGWTEFGDIDRAGHDRGWKMVDQLDGLINELRIRIAELLAAGWKRVEVVTDHGWLLMPGGLPKIELPQLLVENRWGRCASLKPGGSTEDRLFPWYWNPARMFVLADGVSCFRSGEEYAHGGLSFQECLKLRLEVVAGETVSAGTGLEVTDLVWRGLRCTVGVESGFEELLADIRLQAGDPSTSVAVSLKKFRANGVTSVLVEDEELEGREASVVLLDGAGRLVAQFPTVIGGADG